MFFLSKFIAPKSKNEDFIQREFILNILLVASIVLIVFGIFLHTVGVMFQFFDPEAYSNNTLSLLAEIITLIFFISLYILSRKGLFRLAAHLLLGIFFLFATYMTYRWGVDVSAGLLFYTLIIVMAGILINTRFAFVITFFICLALAIVAYLQAGGIVEANRYWTTEKWRFTDVFITSILFAVIATVSWLSNREIEKSLARVRKSEAELKAEHAFLEIKVEERTAELKKAQIEQVSQLYRFAEFGKLSAGLFHDLINPLTAACLNIEQIKNDHLQEIQGVKSHLDKAVMSIKRMENFVIAVKKQMTQQQTESFFSLAEEIRSVIQILEHKAKKANIKINFLPADEIMIYGDPAKFNQIVLNLTANAVDSYIGMDDIGKERKVEIKILLKDGLISLNIQDWGCGIAPELKNKIFQPFFTTKGLNGGTGIGLSLTKRIIENNFRGTIKFESKKKGTIFIVNFPDHYAGVTKNI